LDEEREYERILKEELEKRRKGKKDKEEKEDEEEERQLFVNPLLAFKDDKKGSGSEEWSDDDKYEPKDKQTKKEKKLLGKRKGLQKDMDEVRDFFKNDPIEEVPLQEFKEKE
jgi:hypothetical protein